MQLDRNALQSLRDDMTAALASIAELHGVQINVGNCTFTGTNATFKVNIATTNEDGSVNTKEAEDFKVYCLRYGMQPSDLGRSFSHHGGTYTVTGCKPRSRKYPILAVDGNGRTYKFAADYVVARLLQGDGAAAPATNPLMALQIRAAMRKLHEMGDAGIMTGDWENLSNDEVIAQYAWTLEAVGP